MIRIDLPIRFKSLCFSAGGITGFVHIGALARLEEEDALRTVDTVVGTSIGAVVGLLFAIGLSASVIFDEFARVNDSVFKYGDMTCFFTSYGADSGEYFMAYVIDLLLKSNVSPVITFKDFHQRFGKRLIFTGSSVGRATPCYFGPDSHPDMRVLEALRITISIPFLFTSVEKGDEIFVDGAITDHHPIEYCLRDLEQRYPDVGVHKAFHAFGCLIECNFSKEIRNLEDFLHGILMCCIANKQCDTCMQDSSIKVVVDEVRDAADFNASMEQRTSMYNKGYAETDRYLRKLKEKIFSKKRRHSVC